MLAVRRHLRSTPAMPDLINELSVILALVLANGVFSGAEIALVAVRTARLEALAEEGDRSARAALELKRQPEQLLATVQVGITVIGASAAAVGGASVAERLAPVIAQLPWLALHAEQIALAVVVAGVSYLSIVLGELVPKSLALRSADGYALLVARPLLFLSHLATPIVKLLTMSSNIVLRPLGDRTNFSESRYSAEEIQQLVEDAKKTGSLHPHAADIASRALQFPELHAFEVMVPRREVVALPRNSSLDELKQLMVERPHSRFPVYEGTTDEIIGYVNIKDVATMCWQRDSPSIEDVLRPAYFVPGSKPAVDLLTDMQQRRVPLAIVVEEQGGLAGIITIEDLIEELVGEIFTETTRDVSQPYVEQPDGSWVIAGNVPVRELNRSLGLDLPEGGDWNTLAGLFINLAGRIPEKGELQTLPDGVVMEVLDASPRRIRSVRLRPVVEESTALQPN
jgi:putative hemolysin